MKMNKFDEKALSETFLGTILLALYNSDKLNKWQVVKHYNNITKEIQKNGSKSLDDIIKSINVELPSNFCVVYHEDGKYSPVATRFFIHAGKEKVILPVSLNDGYVGILNHLNDKKVHIVLQHAIGGYNVSVDNS